MFVLHLSGIRQHSESQLTAASRELKNSHAEVCVIVITIKDGVNSANTVGFQVSYFNDN